MKDILRKCAYCDKDTNKTIKIGESKFLYCNSRYYHYDCFIKYKNEHNRFKLSQEEIIKKADKLVLKTKTIKSVKESIDRDRLTYWLYDNYNITSLPNLFFQKLQKINNGTYDVKIIVPISNYDLLQIFKKMKSKLDKIYGNNERLGKTMDLTQRVNYDLAIVLNNYDEYVKWKQKQKTEDVEKITLQEEIKSKNSIQFNNITTIQKNNVQQENDEEINIANILDEVF